MPETKRPRGPSRTTMMLALIYLGIQPQSAAPLT